MSGLIVNPYQAMFRVYLSQTQISHEHHPCSQLELFSASTSKFYYPIFFSCYKNILFLIILIYFLFTNDNMFNFITELSCDKTVSFLNIKYIRLFPLISHRTANQISRTVWFYKFAGCQMFHFLISLFLRKDKNFLLTHNKLLLFQHAALTIDFQQVDYSLKYSITL